METTYLTKSYEHKNESQTLLVVNLMPEYRWDQREAVKKKIEEQLYDVFRKYIM